MKQRKRQTFHFSAHGACTVLLVGDFTNWRQQPISMRKRNGGLWTTSVELPPGEHRYRFIVDGEWRDDPEYIVRVPNGSENMRMAA